ncbi:E3 ubiquitin-protein ligase rnf213-beta-like, partial [Saccostrea cucullata]|uniref:E3 ubiquitin-protein ligase rnf213-beta-like n=1 Tax=Saccostrea cuccullata TaxID=36930 RepID=UPI002ED1FB35
MNVHNFRCQKFFLRKVELGENIAKNQALMENVFMMTVCIELRIPLFLIGKPGSSKSLAKTIVANAMQGRSSHSDFFKQLKEVQMVSFQCSPLSVSEGIVATFRQCALYQKDKNLDKFASVVVLDEVGLAEDSPKMPLKALHPLLEDGCIGNDVPEPHKKHFVRDLDIPDPLNPREVLYRGRTNDRRLYCEEGDMRYVDVCSLYPYVLKHRPFPLGHPEIITDEFQE